MSTIRTAHAFGTQTMLASLYDAPTKKAYDADCRGAVALGLGLSTFFFFMYAAYALGEFRALLLHQHAHFYVHISSIQLWDHAY
jgi:ATP-binding cassette subfamily B (MDR/TAP) protein 1